MALQTNVFRDGQWRTETVNIHTILKGASTTAPEVEDVLPEPPSCGILTRTLVESPVAHWILPARIRSANFNDVVFVGDHYVQVNELREGGQLHEILRKNDFGSRIQNAHIIGNLYERPESGDDDPVFDRVKQEEEEDSQMVDYTATRRNSLNNTIPPHLLLLVLESGDFVFLFIRRHEERLRFVESRFSHPSHSMGPIGFHVAVDPNSRYIAVADFENMFVVYEMESWETMGEQYSRSSSFSPIKSYNSKVVEGLIHKMAFLHPRPEDDFHVILLLVLVKKGSSNMVLFDWERGESLEQAISGEKQGHRMPRQHRMPLSIVPLTVRSSFLIVSETAIAICKDPLQGPPEYEGVDPGTHSTTSYHHGQRAPLWTAWDRPVRRRGYYEGKDNIYLAREDGVIVFLEFNSTDVLSATMNVGSCNCSVSTAFTTMYDAFTDVAIVVGDSGPGMICQLRPREPIIALGRIPNWSPALDFVTTEDSVSWDSRRGRTVRHQGYDRIFAISGKGIQGSIAELHRGIAANIGWEIGYGSPSRQSWIFEAELPHGVSGYHLLLSLPDSSDVLQVSRGTLEAERPSLSTVQFDLGSRTLAASSYSEEGIVQVTETSITLMTPTQHSQHTYEVSSGIRGKAEQATIRGDFVAVTMHDTDGSTVYVFKLESMRVSLVHDFACDGEVTSLAFGRIGNRGRILAGVSNGTDTYLAVFALGEDAESTPVLNRLEGCKWYPSSSPLDYSAALWRAMLRSIADIGIYFTASTEESAQALETITSIAVVEENESAVSIALGCRSGSLVMMTMNGNNPSQVFVSKQELGTGALQVIPVDNPRLPGSVLACCDNQLVLLQDFDARRTGQFRGRQRIVPHDIEKPTSFPPPVTHATVLRRSIGQSDHLSLLIVSEDRILVTEMFPRSKVIPRYLPLGGTPSKLLFSHTLQCLIVAAKIGSGQPTIMFIDPDTGEDISFPTDKDGSPLKFINGLGSSGGKIHDVIEWLYTKDGKTWLFLVVTTREGQLLIISTERVKNRNGSDKIRHWTRYKKKVGERPVYAVVGDGADLIYCAGQVLHWEVLDLVDKKLKEKKAFEIPSPAICLQIINGKVYVLTQDHSLLIFKHKEDGEELALMHSDVGSRKATHYIEMGDGQDEGDATWPVTLVCELTRTFAGLWVPWKEHEKELQQVFSGTLPAGVRRLRRGHVRPSWLTAEVKYGHIPSTGDGADILGMCLDGSIQHFALLTPEACRFLRLVEMLAVGRKQGAGESRRDTTRQHVNGDLMKVCLDRKILGELFPSEQGVDAAALLRERLDELDGGRWTVGFEGSHEKYLDLAYDVLEYYLSPIF